MSKTILQLEKLSKSYRQGRSCIEILKNCDYQVVEGSVNAIIGPSGSGKSTLLHMAGLLDQPSSGKVYFDNVQVDEYSAKEAAQLRLHEMGFIYQNHHLLRDFSAVENVAMPLWIKGKSHAKSLEEAESLLSELNLQNRLYNFPGELSGGEQQRVAIARAIIHKPKLILADEPTGNLDPEASKQVFDILLALVRKNNLTAVIVTHNHELARKSDTIYELPAGQFISN